MNLTFSSAAQLLDNGITAGTDLPMSFPTPECALSTGDMRAQLGTLPTGVGWVFSRLHLKHLTPSYVLECTASPWVPCLRPLFLGKAPFLLSPNSGLCGLLSPDHPSHLLSCQAPSLNFFPGGNSLLLCFLSGCKPPLAPM